MRHLPSCSLGGGRRCDASSSERAPGVDYCVREAVISQTPSSAPMQTAPPMRSSTLTHASRPRHAVKMMHIVQINRYIQSGLGGLQAKNVAEWWDSLQVECAMFINSDLPGMPSAMHTQGKRLRGFVQRLKGKQGRFRGNLSGERARSGRDA